MFKVNRKQLAAILLAQGISLSANTLPVFASSRNDIVMTQENTKTDNTEQGVRNLSTNQSDYYVVYIDGKMYLTTRKKLKDTVDDIYQYYDVKNGDFIGQTITANFDKRVENEISNYEFGFHYSLGVAVESYGEANFTVYGALNDKLYFDGEYGLGKNIPTMAVTPLYDLKISGSHKVTSEWIEHFANHPEELKPYYEKNRYCSTEAHLVHSIAYDIQPNPKFSGFSIGSDDYDKLYDSSIEWFIFNPVLPLVLDASEGLLAQDPFNTKIDVTYYDLPLRNYICEKRNGTVEQYIGYRCSLYQEDNGYQYIYDGISGTIVDVTSYKSITGKYDCRYDCKYIYQIQEILEQDKINAMRKNGILDNNYKEITEESIGVSYDEITGITIHFFDYDNSISIYYGESSKEFQTQFNNDNVIYIIKQCENLEKLCLYDGRHGWGGATKPFSESVNPILKSIQQPENLTQLVISGSNYVEKGFVDFGNINQFKNLVSLTLEDLDIIDIGELNLSQLQYLRLSGNKLTELSNLENLPNLYSLDITNNSISDISQLKSSSLVSIDISNNYLTEFADLENLPNLYSLNITNNYLITTTSYIKEYYVEKRNNPMYGFQLVDDGQKYKKVYQKK